MKSDDDNDQNGPELGGLLREVRPQGEGQDAAGQPEADQDKGPLDSGKLK